MWLLSILQMQCKARQIQFSRRTNPKTPQKKSGSLIRANSRSCKSCLKCSGWISRLPGDPPCPWTSRRVRASRACTSGVDRCISKKLKPNENKNQNFAGWREEQWPSDCDWDVGGRRQRGGHLIACVAGGLPLSFPSTIVILVINLTLQWARQRWPWKWKFVKSSLQFHWF